MDLPKLFVLHWQLMLFIFLCIVAFLQLFFYLFFFSRLAFYQPTTKTSSQTHAVSAIICARDEAENLARNLPGVLVQNYKTTHEVIVVNDNSYDESKYILEELKKEFRQMQVVELTQEAKMIPGKKFPLSIGIKTAKHEVLLLTDADCVPASENWMESMQSTYDNNTEIVLGYGPYHKKKGLLNKLIRWETFHTALQYMSYALAGIPYMGVGRNLSYKKLVFFRHKGFSAHNHLPGGDDDLFINAAATKTNTKINIDPESFTLSTPAGNWGQWLKQKRRHYTTSKFYRPLHKFLLGLYAFCNFAFYPLLIACAITYSWKLGLAIFSMKLLTQAVVYARAMNKLGEKDLIPYLLFFDLWMFFYYLLFAPALMRKPRQHWK
ncbi:MAG: glycosyltransferase [Gloeobacteraceae cyanobacterium ES-bin-316]|nr:glycosyltransferase [Ferruginibacter sp.]